MTAFEIIDRADVPEARRSKGRPPTALSLALVQGQTVFLPGADHRTIGGTRNPSSYVSQQGLLLRSRMGERDGVTGLFVWAVPK